MKIRTILPLVLILFALGALAFQGTTNQGTQPQEHPEVNAPTTAGQWTTNGSLVVLFYDDQLGFSEPVCSGMYHYNTIYYEGITTGPTYQAKVTVEQWKNSQEQITEKIGNITTTRTITVMSDIQYDNQTIMMYHHQISVGSLKIPKTNETMGTMINIDGAKFDFLHKSIPNEDIMPFSTSPLETWLLAIVLIAIIFMASLSASVAILKKVLYVPQIGAAMWSLILIGILGGGLLFIFAFYYDLPYVPWWSYLIPVFLLGLIYGTEKISNISGFTPVKSIYLFGIDDKGGKSEPQAHRKRLYVADMHQKAKWKIPEGEQYSGWVVFDPDSRLEVFKRLLGKYTPVTFREGPRPWMMDLGAVEDFRHDDKYLIFTDPRKSKGYFAIEFDKWTSAPDEKKKEKFSKWFKAQASKRFFIPVHGHHYIHMAKFIQGYETTAALGEAVDDLTIMVDRLEVMRDLKFLEKRGERIDIVTEEVHKIINPKTREQEDEKKDKEEKK